MNNLFFYDYDLSQLEKITTKRYGFDLFITPRFKGHFVDNVYEETTALLSRQNAKGVKTFIDVGAHYGFFDVLVGLSNPDCKILAFEPVPENVEILRKNLELNHVSARIYQNAVSDQSGRAAFQISKASDNSGFIANPAAEIVRNIETDVVPLDQFLSEIPDGPVLIKIDTEGNEIKVLEGMQKIFEKITDLRLVIEFNPICLAANKASPQDLLDKILNLGFDIFFINDDVCRYEKYHPGRKWHDFMGERTYRNLYCVRKELSTNVLIFSHSSNLAGSERSLLELVRELIADYGKLCTVILPSHGPSEGLLQQAGAATIIAPLNLWAANTEPSDKAKTRQLLSQSFGWINENLHILNQINPDVVFTNTLVIPWGAVAATLLKRPHIWMVNEFGELDQGFRFFLPFPQILGLIEASSDKIVTNSKAVQKELFPQLNSNRIKTIYRYIDFPDKQSIPDSPEHNFYLHPEACHLVISGTIVKAKGQEDAVRAVIELIKHRNRQAELVIVGYAQPEFQNYIQEIINSEGVNDYIRIVPFQENVIPILISSDIVLVCSRMEAFGRVTLEAMLMEKAVIATNTGGTVEMIFNGKTGLLYNPGNYRQLADQIEKLLDNPNKRINLAHNALQYAKRTFTKGKFGGEYNKLLGDLRNREYQNKEGMTWFLVDQYRLLIDQKEQSVQALTAQVDGKKQTVQALSAQVAEKEQSVQALSAQVAEITGSRAWRLMQFLRRIKITFVPLGSRRARLAGLILKGLKVLSTEGLIVLIRRVLGFSRQKDTNSTDIRIPAKPAIDKRIFDNLDVSIEKVIQAFSKEPVEVPDVSIVIPVYNHLEDTLRCLLSLAMAGEKTQFEVIVADDASTDGTQSLMTRCQGLRYIRNELNIGFLRNCNYAATVARGKYIMFLNNDVIVTPEWLDGIIDTFLNFPRAGLVGSKLLYPNGTLQEAGGVIWNDGTGMNYGKGRDPSKPEYNYLREVDYCSGASIVIPRGLWEQLGGFDEFFALAYYEDVDLAFRVRQAGYQVIYQPLSVVFHVEGATSGIDLGTGIKHYQEINRHKFVERWGNIIKTYGTNEDTEEALYRERVVSGRVLYIDDLIPMPDQSAGAVQAECYLTSLRKAGYAVTFLPHCGIRYEGDYTRYLQKWGIESLYWPYVTSSGDYIKQNGHRFSHVVISRASVAEDVIDLVKKFAPQAKIIFNTVDLHFLRLERAAQLSKKNEEFEIADYVKKLELSIIMKADCTLVVSEAEDSLLSDLLPGARVKVVPFPADIHEPEVSFEERHDVVFLGSFRHPPNSDAVLYFAREIWPLVTKRLPGARFLIAGSDVPTEIQKLASRSVLIEGYVDDLEKFFSTAKLSVAPIRFGAGIKGKVLNSLGYGVPCVLTSIAAEGMGLTSDKNCIIVDSPGKFADAVVGVYTQPKKWALLSSEGQDLIRQKYSRAMVASKLLAVFKDLDK
jgi:FkbM family methyltransferase